MNERSQVHVRTPQKSKLESAKKKKSLSANVRAQGALGPLKSGPEFVRTLYF